MANLLFKFANRLGRVIDDAYYLTEIMELHLNLKE
jgi:dihydrodipicolinate reductase